MGWILLLFTIVLAIIALLAFRNNYLSVTFLTAGVFSVAITIAIVNQERWGFNLSVKTALVLLSYLVPLFAGELLANYIRIGKTKRKIIGDTSSISVSISSFAILIDICLCLYLIYKRIGDINYVVGAYYGIAGAQTSLGTVRNAENLGVFGSEGNVVISMLGAFCTAFFYVCAYSTISTVYDRVKRKTRVFDLKFVSNCFVVLLTILLHVLSLAKINLFTDLAFMVFAYLIIYFRDRGFRRIRRSKVIKLIVISSVAFYIIMLVLTKLREGADVNIWDTISGYTGASIAALNKYLEDPTSSSYFGQETFAGLRYTLHRIGFNTQFESITYDPYVFLPGMHSNIYTCIYDYFCDFGWLGIPVFGFLFGNIMGLLRKVASKTDNYLWVILYAYYTWQIVYQVFGEGLFSGFMSIGRLLNLFFIVLIYRLFVVQRSDVRGLQNAGYSVRKQRLRNE